MKSLYFLTSLVALAAAIPSPAPAPAPGLFEWIGNKLGRNNNQQRQRTAAVRANTATSAEVRFFSDQAPRGQAFNVSLPSTTVINVEALRNPTRMQMVRGPEGREAVCYVLDEYGMIREDRRFSEGLDNAYVAPQESTPTVGFISCAIQEQDVSQVILRFSSPGSNTAQISDQRVAVPGAVRVNDPALQRSTQVTMIAHPVPNTICFIIDEIVVDPTRMIGKTRIIGQVSIESRTPFQSPNGQPNIKFISCLPPAENLQQ